VTTQNTDVHALALDKVSKILGPVRARMLLAAFLARREQTELTSAADLHAFGLDLAEYGGTEVTIGAVLCREAARMDASDNQE
jgi:hypothetical protein